MLINSIDNSIFRTRDFIEGAKLWNELYSRYKYFSIESIMHYYEDTPVTGLALYDDNLKLVGICIYIFNTPYGSKDKNMVINHFCIHPDVRKSFMAGKFLKKIETVARDNQCAAILYPDCTFNKFFEKHSDKYKVLEVTYKQEL